MEDTTGGTGTRFLLYPQAPTVPGYDRPELVWISAPQGSLMPGPTDDRMTVVDPAAAKSPYEYPYLPPFAGAVHPPAAPGPDGHFDHIDPGDRAFAGVHAFGCVARVLDVWEGWLGHRIRWHFADRFERLEIVPLLEWDNAQSGFGYLEFGYDTAPDGRRHPFALNFDVIAHEIGHSILFAEIGLPSDRFRPGADFVAFHEAAADLCSLLGMLTFDTALDRLLRRGRGNLLAMNELNAFAELADERQVRIAGNARRMSDVGFEPHDRSRPFTGAVFDAIVGVYHALAVERGLVSLPRMTVTDARDFDSDVADTFRDAFAADYGLKHFALKGALADARDTIGRALARSWGALDNGTLTLAGAGFAVCDALQAAGQGAAAEIAMDCFAWREILSPAASARLRRAPGRPAAWI